MQNNEDAYLNFDVLLGCFTFNDAIVSLKNRVMKNKKLALHLIKEDMQFHKMVAVCNEVDVTIDFYPDLASAVKVLLGQEEQGDPWDDLYVQEMVKAVALGWKDHKAINIQANEVLAKLSAERVAV